MDVTALRERFESVPYGASLGVRIEDGAVDRVRIRVPYKDENSNPGRALHGGVAASTIDIAGALAAWTGVDATTSLECGTLDLSVNYLAAAIGEDIVATAEVLRRGKEIVYSAADVRTDAGKRIATGLSTYRLFDRAASPGAAERQRSTVIPVSDGGAAEVAKGANTFVMLPFVARLGIQVERAHDGNAILAMPFLRAHGDADGAPHEGALAALIDTTGALASWSITGLNFSYKASTVGLHVNYHDRAPGEAVLADARTVRRNNEIFLNHVTVRARGSGRVVATGSVTYRIVVPD